MRWIWVARSNSPVDREPEERDSFDNDKYADRKYKIWGRTGRGGYMGKRERHTMTRRAWFDQYDQGNGIWVYPS